MAKWASASLLDGGSDLLRTLAATTDRIKQHVLKAYSAGDPYATVVSNSCGSVSLVPGDIVQSTVSNNRVTTFGAQDISLTADSGASPAVHTAIVDVTGTAVLYVTDDTLDQQLFSGNTAAVPAFTMTFQQPT